MKKFMFFVMALGSFLAFCTMAITLISGTSSLPSVIFILRGILVAGAVVLVIKKNFSWVRRSELSIYFLAESAVTIFNLVYLSMFSHADVSWFEFPITGTLLTPVFNILLVLVLTKLSNRYVMFDRVEEAAPERVGVVRGTVRQS